LVHDGDAFQEHLGPSIEHWPSISADLRPPLGQNDLKTHSGQIVAKGGVVSKLLSNGPLCGETYPLLDCLHR
jgi:hypothetical protein